MTRPLGVWDRSEISPLESTEMNLGGGGVTLLPCILVTDNKKEDAEMGG